MPGEKKNRIGSMWILIGLTCIPLIVSGKKYSSGLCDFSWFSHADVTYDFFLYWKVQAWILWSGVVCLYASWKVLWEGRMAFGKVEKKYAILLGVYLLTALLSTVCSEQRTTAVYGGYEQWEGMIMLAVYALLMMMSYTLMKGKVELSLLANGLLAGVGLMAVLCAMQAAGYDFFRTSAGKAVMNVMLESRLDVAFRFEPGRVYGTLYNPNYVGSYVALLFPVVMSLVPPGTKGRRWGRSIFAAMVLVLFVVMLFGSGSVTGVIGVLASMVLLAMFLVGKKERRTKKLVAGGAVCLAVFAVVVGIYWETCREGFDKIMNPTPDCMVITALESAEGSLMIRTVQNQIVKVTAEGEEDSLRYTAEDGEGNAVVLSSGAEENTLCFQDERFEEIELVLQERWIEGKERSVLQIVIPTVGQTYTIVPGKKEESSGRGQMSYEILNPFNRLDSLRHIPQIGFQDNQHFGSRRGFIWSRTFPLLKEHILLGSGPNTFVYEFPNDDYVGMTNVGYEGAIVTKPHNMYLQMFVQTGMVSVVAFLAIYVIYFVECVTLYWNKRRFSFLSKFGIGIWMGTFGYLVTGIGNDSTVCVAPLFWCILGVGLAVNRREKQKTGGNDDTVRKNEHDEEHIIDSN